MRLSVWMTTRTNSAHMRPMSLGKVWYGVATLVGTVIGVGIFGLPYSASRAGFFVQLAYLAVFAGVFMLLHLMFAEIILRTTGRHRLSGYVGIYLGAAAKKIMELTTIIGVLGGMLVYILAGGSFLRVLTGGAFWPIGQYYIIFWAAMSIILFLGPKIVERSEVVMLVFIVLIIALLCVVSLPFVRQGNYFFFAPGNFFFPYGITLFALAGTAAIPEVCDILRGEERKIKKTIILGAIITVVLYAIFIFSVLGVTGAATSEDALTGLNGMFGVPMVLVGALFGVLVVATSYVVFGLYLRDTLWYDFGVHQKTALWFVLVVPLLLVLSPPGSLIEVIGFLGAIFGGAEAVFLILTFKKARQRGDRVPEYQVNVPVTLLYALIALFTVGIAYTLLDGKINLLQHYIFNA